MKRRHTKRGVALLVAVIVSSLMLSISAAMSNIFIKEYTLASSGMQSQVAFDAADAAVECAIYFDVRENQFDQSNLTGSVNCGAGPSISTGSQTSSGASPNGLVNSVIGGATVSMFTVFYGNSGEEDLVSSCALVTVDKNPGGGLVTHITARGYNTCDNTNPRRTERAVDAQY